MRVILINKGTGAERCPYCKSTVQSAVLEDVKVRDHKKPEWAEWVWQCPYDSCQTLFRKKASTTQQAQSQVPVVQPVRMPAVRFRLLVRMAGALAAVFRLLARIFLPEKEVLDVGSLPCAQYAYFAKHDMCGYDQCFYPADNSHRVKVRDQASGAMVSVIRCTKCGRYYRELAIPPGNPDGG
ncbi:MAG: hypothetical protein ABIG66_03405 [Candidatus Kerfeldbacteria bacterium]